MKHYKSRIHLLPAQDAPVLVVLQRRRSKQFHVISIDTKRLRVTEGSWFRGKLYSLRCDVSFDGQHMVYLALGANAAAWNGVCRLPWLRTEVESATFGTWYGGGYFAEKRLLRANGWGGTCLPATKNQTRYQIEPYASRYGGEDLGVLYERLWRDGYRRLGEHWGERRKLHGPTYQVAQDGDEGWGCRPARRYPELKLRYIGYLDHGYTFQFWFDEQPELLADASWACWDSLGALWVARPGLVQQYTREALGRGEPSWTLDVEQFAPPERATE